MTPIKLPADQVLVDGDRIVVVVDGECGHCGPGRVNWHHDLDCGGVPLDPPGWMSAATEPCEHCLGQGCPPSDETAGCGCPVCDDDCRDGRPIVTIGVECERCEGSGVESGLAANTGSYGQDFIDPKCEAADCKDGCTVTYRFTVSEEHPKVLPIRDPYNPLSTGERWVVLSPSGNAALVDEYGAAINAVFPPATSPDQCALIGEVVR